MIVFNDRLYVLLGNNTTFQSINLYSTADGITWMHDMGIQLAAADSPDYGTLDAYCGRVFVATAAYQTNEYNFGWHAPILAKVRPPNYTGGEFRLVPKALNRIYAIWSVYQSDTEAGNWRFLREQEFHAKAKLWIDPRWRSLRDE
jgi:hypothetical protein